MHRIRLHSLGYVPQGKPGKHTVAHAWDSRDNPARRRPGAGDEFDLPFLETRYFRTRAQAEKAADLLRLTYVGDLAP